MKRIIANCVLFGLLITFLCVLYVRLFQVSLSALGILLAVLAIYGFCMEIGWKSAQELKKYEQKAIHFGLRDEGFDGIELLLYTFVVGDLDAKTLWHHRQRGHVPALPLLVVLVGIEQRAEVTKSP
jgi:hypothetical protein